jgi:peptidoglycan/LPS O-acetylase OafA/YrhL
MVRVESLTGLRFFAAAAIVLWHSQLPHLFPWGTFSPFALAGAVSLFFVLSGYVLALNAYKYRSWPDFFVARVARIWPAHIASLLFFLWILYPVSVAGLGGLSTLGPLVLNALLLQAWVPEQSIFWSFNAVAWSISCELFFYLTFPVCLMAARRRLVPAVLVFVCPIAFLLILSYAWHPQPAEAVWLGYINPITSLPIFALGVAFGYWQSRSPKSKMGAIGGTTVQTCAVAAVVAANALFASSSFRVPDAINIFIYYHGAFCAYAFLIFVLGRYNGAISTFLSHRAIVYLGDISFAMYLFHQPILIWHASNYPKYDVNIWVQYIFVWAAILVVSAIAHHAIERPMQKLIRVAWARVRYVARNELQVAPN